MVDRCQAQAPQPRAASPTTTASTMTIRRPTRPEPRGHPRPGSEVLSLVARGYHYGEGSRGSGAVDLRREGDEPPGGVEVEHRLAQDREVAAAGHVGGVGLGDLELAQHEGVLDAND